MLIYVVAVEGLPTCSSHPHTFPSLQGWWSGRLQPRLPRAIHREGECKRTQDGCRRAVHLQCKPRTSERSRTCPSFHRRSRASWQRWSAAAALCWSPGWLARSCRRSLGTRPDQLGWWSELKENSKVQISTVSILRALFIWYRSNLVFILKSKYWKSPNMVWLYFEFHCATTLTYFETVFSPILCVIYISQCHRTL